MKLTIPSSQQQRSTCSFHLPFNSIATMFSSCNNNKRMNSAARVCVIITMLLLPLPQAMTRFAAHQGHWGCLMAVVLH